MNMFRNIIAILFFRLAPIKKTCIVFTSFDGHYSDSPRFISEAMHELAPDIDIIWLTEKRYAEQLPQWITWIDIHTLKADWTKGRAKALVDNVYCDRGYTAHDSGLLCTFKGKLFRILKNKRHQFAYSTWHGVPMKKMGRDQAGNDVTGFFCAPLTIILNNDYSAGIMRHLTYEMARIMCLGSPRNDILFRPELRDSIKKKLGLPDNKRIVLFAPTFRNDGKDVAQKNVFRSGIDQLKLMDFPLLFDSLSSKFGGEWTMVCRFHYHVADMVDWADLNDRYPGRFINGNVHDEMSEYLLCTDILISDASSCVFDFSITKKPVFLFFPDYDNYAGTERGFYISPNELPFPVSVEFDVLLENIRSFDNDSYQKRIAKMFDQLGDYDDGNASQRIAEYILKECGLR